MGGTDFNYPQQPSYGESMRESLQAQVDLAPQLYQAEASQQYGRPAYAQLETDILGANNVGLDSVVVTTGINKRSDPKEFKDMPDNLTPRYILTSLV